VTSVLQTLTYASRLADRLWDRHASALQNMTEDELAGFCADRLEPLMPTISDLQGVVQRLQTHQRDNARPPDAKPMTEDALERLFR
jgi:hypothetical protein